MFLLPDTVFSRSIQYAEFERSVGNSTWGALASVLVTSVNPTAVPWPLSVPLSNHFKKELDLPLSVWCQKWTCSPVSRRVRSRAFPGQLPGFLTGSAVNRTIIYKWSWWEPPTAMHIGVWPLLLWGHSAQPTCYILVAATHLSAALLSSQTHNTKLQCVEFRYN